MPNESHRPTQDSESPDAILAAIAARLDRLTERLDERGIKKKQEPFLPTRLLEVAVIVIAALIVGIFGWMRTVDQAMGQSFTRSQATEMERRIMLDRKSDLDELRSFIRQELRDARGGRIDP